MADNGGISDPNARSQEAVGSVVMLFNLRSTLPAPLTTGFWNYPRLGEPWLLGIPSSGQSCVVWTTANVAGELTGTVVSRGLVSSSFHAVMCGEAVEALLAVFFWFFCSCVYWPQNTSRMYIWDNWTYYIHHRSYMRIKYKTIAVCSLSSVDEKICLRGVLWSLLLQRSRVSSLLPRNLLATILLLPAEHCVLLFW